MNESAEDPDGEIREEPTGWEGIPRVGGGCRSAILVHPAASLPIGSWRVCRGQ